MSKLIESVPQEVWDKIPEYLKKYTTGVYDGQRFNNFVFEKAEELVDHTYENAGFDKPAVIVAENPYEAQMIYQTLLDNPEFQDIAHEICAAKKEGKDYQDAQQRLVTAINESKWSKPTQKYTDYMYILNVCALGYFGWYKFLNDEVVKDKSLKSTLDKFDALVDAGNIFSSICADIVCIVTKYPKKIYVDDEYRLHNPIDVSLEWNHSRPESELKCYYLHGRAVETEKAERWLKGDFKIEEFLQTTHEEDRAFMYDMVGPDKIAEILGTKEVDRKDITHANGETETVVLLRTDKEYPISETEHAYFAWVKYICPTTEQVFMIPCEPHHEDVLEAVASQSPFFDKDDYSFDVRA